MSRPIQNRLVPYQNPWIDTTLSQLLREEQALEHARLTWLDDEEADDEEEDLLFDAPSYLPPLQAQQRPQAKVQGFAGRAFHFHGNYRRFLVFLFFGLLAWSPIIYMVLRGLGWVKPIGLTLLALTLLWTTACLIFFFGSYKRRSITLDDFGVSYKDELREALFSWEELRSIHLHAVEAFFNPYPLCYVRVVTTQGEEFAFANFGSHLFGIQRKVSFGEPPYPIIDIRDADLLLALLVARAPNLVEAPDLERLRFRAQSEVEDNDDAPLRLPSSNKEERPFYLGLWTLMGKIFFKFLPQGMKVLFKSIKPLSAGLSIGLYAIFFRWEFAVLLVSLLIVHELGHVWAMYRAGMKIRGVYMIPFFGAATVTDDAWPSWQTLARVNLAGPLWGTYCVALCLVLYAIFPSPFWLTAAIWGALLNLLNLLPIQPLDGGRILNAIAYSLHSSMGFVLTVLVLGACVIFSLTQEFILLYIFSLIGVAEFFRDYMMRRRADKISLLPEYEQFSVREILLLQSITGINFGVRHAPHILEREEALFKRYLMILQAPQMTHEQILKIGLSTAGIAVSLMTFLLYAGSLHAQAGWVIEIFR